MSTGIYYTDEVLHLLLSIQFDEVCLLLQIETHLALSMAQWDSEQMSA